MRCSPTFMLTCLAACLAACGPRSGGREIKGDIVEDTIWDLNACPVLVTGHLNVRAGRTLEIRPGCVVRFKPGTSLSVSSGTQETGTLRAIGTRNEPIIFTSEAESPNPGDWGGIYFHDTTNEGRTRLEHVQVSGAGGGDRGSAIEIHAARIEMVSVTVTGALGSGFYFGDGGGFAPTSTSINVSQAARYGVSITANQAGTLPVLGSSYTGNMLGAVEIYTSDVTEPQTWRNVGAPYVLTDNLNVIASGSAGLTLDSGVKLQFASGRGINVNGSLRTQGSNGNEVVLTGGTKTRGSWGGVIVHASSGQSSTLSYTRIEYGGANNYQAGLAIYGAQPVLQNVLVTESVNDGIVLTGGASSNPEMRAGSAAVSAKGNTGVGLRIAANQIGTVPEGCDFSGNGDVGVLVEQGLVRKTQTWQAANVPYVFATNLVVGQSTTADTVLTLQPGVTIAFRPGYGISVGPESARGSLRALGQPSNQVVFTSSQTTPLAGDWLGVHFFATAVPGSAGMNGSRLDYAQIRYGGVAGAAALTIDLVAAKPTLETVEIANAAGFGACVADSDTMTALGAELTFTSVAGGSYCP